MKRYFDTKEIENMPFSYFHNFFLNVTLPSLLHVYTPKFISPSELHIPGGDVKITDMTHDEDIFIDDHIKTNYNFVDDISKNGTYWPIFCVKHNDVYYPTDGLHRTIAFKKLLLKKPNLKVFIFYRDIQDIEIENITMFYAFTTENIQHVINRATIRPQVIHQACTLYSPKELTCFPENVDSNFRDVHVRYLNDNNFIYKQTHLETHTTNDEHLKFVLGSQASILQKMLYLNRTFQPSPLINKAENESFWIQLKKQVKNKTYDFKKEITTLNETHSEHSLHPTDVNVLDS